MYHTIFYFFEEYIQILTYAYRILFWYTRMLESRALGLMRARTQPDYAPQEPSIIFHLSRDSLKYFFSELVSMFESVGLSTSEHF